MPERPARVERSERYFRSREELARLKKSLGGAIGRARQLVEYYRRRYEATRAEVFRERLRRYEQRLNRLLELRSLLERYGWDVYALALAEVWSGVAAGRGRFEPPDWLPRQLRAAWEEALAQALDHHTRFGSMRTGWDALVDCDGSVLDVLKTVRPHDRACFYAYMRFSEPIQSRSGGRRVRTTDTVTELIGCGRLVDASFDALKSEALRLALQRVRLHGVSLEGDPCIVLKPT